MWKTSPYDRAIANFKCELSHQRLLSTPDEELALALGKLPRGIANLSAVYVVGNDANSLLKIGYADNLRSRLSGLRCNSPVETKLLHFLYFVDGMVAKHVESAAHKTLAARRRHGEWFEASLEEVAWAIASVVSTNKLRWWTEEERHRLGRFIEQAYARHEERARLFGA